VSICDSIDSDVVCVNGKNKKEVDLRDCQVIRLIGSKPVAGDWLEYSIDKRILFSSFSNCVPLSSFRNITEPGPSLSR
jgi:hypothetical protein